MLININIPKEVETALSILNKNNFEAYIVGGCVRDSLLGNSPNDWDITTSAKTDEIISSFQNYRTINTGLKHGTVTVLIGKMQLEITTYRIDGSYTDNRRPDMVFFTDSVSHDLKRRDFTINALAYNKDGIVDLFGGISDIENKVIKCVGISDERFNEDGLRILRALRFASVLGFYIEKNTSSSIHKNKELLNNISRERISSEFSKLVKGSNYYDILMEYNDVIGIFVPEIKCYNKESLENVLNSMNYTDDLIIKLALFLYKTNNAENILKNLKYDKATVKAVKEIVSQKDIEILPDKINIKKQLNLIGYDSYISLIKFKTAIFSSQRNKYEQELINIKHTEKILNYIVLHNECYSLKMMKINGEILMQEGFTKGIHLGSILNEILKLIIEEKLENKKEILIDYVRKYKMIKN